MKNFEKKGRGNTMRKWEGEKGPPKNWLEAPRAKSDPMYSEGEFEVMPIFHGVPVYIVYCSSLHTFNQPSRLT